MIASIGVASATLPPYSLTDCEIAPMFAAHARRVRAVDRRAREARARSRRVHRRPGHLERGSPAAARRLAGRHVEHLHVERADRRALDHRIAGAAHARPAPATAACRIARKRRSSGHEQGPRPRRRAGRMRMKSASLGGLRTNRHPPDETLSQPRRSPPDAARSPLVRAHPLAHRVVADAVLAPDALPTQRRHLRAQLLVRRPLHPPRARDRAARRAPSACRTPASSTAGARVLRSERRAAAQARVILDRRRFARPQCVSSVAAQFGHTIRRFSSRLSSATPLMWSRISDIRRPRHSSP